MRALQVAVVAAVAVGVSFPELVHGVYPVPMPPNVRRFSNVRHLLQWSASTLEYDENERGRPLSEVTDRVIASRLETQLATHYAATQDRIFNMVVWETLGQGAGLDIIDDLAACNVPEPADECLDSDGFLQNELQFAGSTRHYAIFWLQGDPVLSQRVKGHRTAVKICTTGYRAERSLQNSRGSAQGVAQCVVDMMTGNRRYMANRPRVVLVVPYSRGLAFEGRIFITNSPRPGAAGRFVDTGLGMRRVTVVILPAARPIASSSG